MPSEPSLLGTWHLTREDGSHDQAATTDLTFTADGRLVYAVLAGTKWQIMRLTYRCEGTYIITNQPSAPREERTSYWWEPDGTLGVEFGGERTWFRRGEPRAPSV